MPTQIRCAAATCAFNNAGQCGKDSIVISTAPTVRCEDFKPGSGAGGRPPMRGGAVPPAGGPPSGRVPTPPSGGPPTAARSPFGGSPAGGPPPPAGRSPFGGPPAGGPPDPERRRKPPFG